MNMRKFFISAHQLICPMHDEKTYGADYSKKRLHSPEAPEKRRRTSSSSSTDKNTTIQTNKNQPKSGEVPKADKNPPKTGEVPQVNINPPKKVQNKDKPQNSKKTFDKSENNNKSVPNTKPYKSTKETESKSHEKYTHRNKKREVDNGSLLFKYYSNR